MLAVVLSLLLSLSADASSLMGRPQQLTSDLVPHQVWIFNYEYGSSGLINSTYNSRSQSESLASNLSRTLTIADVVKAVADPGERALAEAAFESHGLNGTTQAGTVTNDLNIRFSSQAYVLGYGATEYLSLLFVAPRINVKLDLQTSLAYSPQVNSMIAKLREDGQTTRADEIESKRATVLGDQLSKYNYNPSYINEYDGVPSFNFVARSANRWMRKRQISTETMLTIPNKQDRYIDQFTPLEFFEDSISFTQSLNASYDVIERFRLTGVTSYRLRTPYKRDMRVPESSDINFSNDKRSVRGKDGDEWSVGAQLSRPTKFLTPFAGVLYRQKFSDRFQSDGIDSSRFDSLTKFSAQDLTTMTLGAHINTIDLFMREKFVIPIQVGAMYSKTLAGRNAFESEVFAANFMVFYK